jgi:hypothetical protein
MSKSRSGCVMPRAIRDAAHEARPFASIWRGVDDRNEQTSLSGHPANQTFACESAMRSLRAMNAARELSRRRSVRHQRALEAARQGHAAVRFRPFWPVLSIT